MSVPLRGVAGVGVNWRDDLCYGISHGEDTHNHDTGRNGCHEPELAHPSQASDGSRDPHAGPEAAAEEPKSLGTFRDWSALRLHRRRTRWSASSPASRQRQKATTPSVATSGYSERIVLRRETGMSSGPHGLQLHGECTVTVDDRERNLHPVRRGRECLGIQPAMTTGTS